MAIKYAPAFVIPPEQMVALEHQVKEEIADLQARIDEAEAIITEIHSEFLYVRDTPVSLIQRIEEFLDRE